nr:MAG TPA: hypothetical protein [Caudoviricetes sp.]
MTTRGKRWYIAEKYPQNSPCGHVVMCKANSEKPAGKVKVFDIRDSVEHMFYFV